MPTMFVIIDRYNWQTPVEGVPGRWQHNTAGRGERIDVTDVEARRGILLSALSADVSAVVAAEAEAHEQAPWPDEQLRSASARDLIAYMGQRPTEAERVKELEAAERGDKARPSVLDSADRIIEERDAALEDLADARERAETAAAEDAAARAAAGGAPTAGSNAV